MKCYFICPGFDLVAKVGKFLTPPAPVSTRRYVKHVSQLRNLDKGDRVVLINAPHYTPSRAQRLTREQCLEYANNNGIRLEAFTFL